MPSIAAFFLYLYPTFKPTNNSVSTGNINVDLKIIDSYFKAAISVDCVIFGFDENELKVLLMIMN